ncbi:MAG: 23S rRNA (uracil(1939)-C(5))-methyltransferase RlmD [Betaproteobacteria bacterium]|nr:23S rRNA (uracil(1939)-C(5))-methyltransferase RlmD [Betaproteobacteria bacterium]
MPSARIESLDQEGRGITHLEGKTIFVDGGLPGETVVFSSYRKKPNYELAQLERVLSSSSQRVAPRCPHFGVCGGCSMQHLEPRAQVAAKQRVLEDALWHLARVRAERLLPAIEGPIWGYRQRARLSVRHVLKKGTVLVGFHEKRSSYVADMQSCAVLPPAVSDLLLPLRALVMELSVRDRLPQIEVAVGRASITLVLRILDPLAPADHEPLRVFAERHGVCIDLQPKGPDSAFRLYPQEGTLDYALPEFGVLLPFRPTDFTQVNASINRVLVRRALNLLAPGNSDRVLDLFCGLGNFTLPIASCGARVTGIEGSVALVKRARENAAHNGLAERCEFLAADLFEPSAVLSQALDDADKLLIDPPREGAITVVKALEQQGPRRIVYVSCNPATLARDTAVLVHEKDYRLKAAGVVNMFPHTAHVESVAWFERS